MDAVLARHPLVTQHFAASSTTCAFWHAAIVLTPERQHVTSQGPAAVASQARPSYDRAQGLSKPSAALVMMSLSSPGSETATSTPPRMTPSGIVT